MTKIRPFLLLLFFLFYAPNLLASDKISVQGSDTLLEMVTAIAGEYGKHNKGFVIQVTGGGSGTGIASLINSTVDLANSSRPIKKKEIKYIEKKGDKVFQISIALDGISVYVNKKNKIDSISMQQLADIYAGKINNWKEVGGSDIKIIRYSRENNSGSYVFFKEHVLDKENYAADCQNLPGTASVVNAVSRDPNSIGYGGYSYSKGVKLLKVNGVAPSLETISKGEYPISRTLYQYTRNKPKGFVKEFIKFELSEKGQKIASDAGYIPLPEKIRKQMLQEIE